MDIDTNPPNDGLKGLAPIEPRHVAGKMPNAQHQKTCGFMTGAPYELAIVEFDDQGRCYDRAQIDAVTTRLDELRASKTDVILIAFVHGWKHDARTDDENLSAFRRLLTQTAEYEKSTCGAVAPRPVMGVFIGWRGLSEFGLGDAIADTTFWGRQAAGQRVAVGSVRELFGRFRHYRGSLLKQKGKPLLVIAGHSFGGMIVFSALAQSLIEAASDPAPRLAPRFADLVLLINPAIEGARYLPIHDLVTAPAFRSQATPQLPAFVCAQAENDVPIGKLFPVGNVTHRFSEATIGTLEKECTTHTIGFVSSFRTHTLEGTSGDATYRLNPPGLEQPDPFWVIGADKAVIDGHGGIWQRPFLRFLADLLFRHIEVSATSVRTEGP